MPAAVKIYLSVLLIFSIHYSVQGQLCTGSLGDPVVNITFGAGNNPGAPLSAATISYTYVGNDCPNDGSYSIRNKTANCFLNHWHTLNNDHTGDPNGYFMLVNASFAPSDFYLQRVDGLCPNTTYEFAAWLLNMCNQPGTILPNVTFSIEKTDGTVLSTYDSGDIPVTSVPKWVQYGFYFKTPANITSVVIRMRNNANGGNGNDIALDDITFRPCGPKVNATVSGNVSNRVDLCEGSNQTISIGSSVSAGYLQPMLQWQVSADKGATWKDIPGASADTYLRPPTNSGEFWYRLTVAEANNIGIQSCRVASDPVAIVVHALPVVHLVTDPKLCAGNTLTLSADVGYNSGSPRDLIWRYPDAALQVTATAVENNDSTNTGKIIQTIIHIPVSASGTYALTVRNSFGCERTDSASLIVNPAPNANFVFSSPLCEKNAVHFESNATGQYPILQYNWSFGDSSRSAVQNPLHAYASAGNFLAALVVGDANGCLSDTARSALQIHPLPQPDFGLPRLCLADPAAQFTDSSVIADHTEAGFVYSWNFGDPGNTAGQNISNAKDPRHQYAATGNYPVSLTVTSQDGCTSDTTKIFTLNGSQVKAGMQLDNILPLCSGDSIRISNSSSVNFGSLVKLSIYWDYAHDPMNAYTDNAPSPAKEYQHSYYASMNQPAADITIRMAAYSGLNCFAETEQVIHMNRSAELTFGPLQGQCLNSPPFLLTGASETTGATGSGKYVGDGVTDSLFNPRGAGTGSHKIVYQFTTSAGCITSADQTINVLPPPAVNAGEDKTIIKGGWTRLNGQASGNAPLHYAWSPPDFADNASAPNPKVSPPASTQYVLTVTSTDGCMNTDSVRITVLNGLYVPSAFTPNADGLNDLWRLPVLDSYPKTEVWIYDRWGSLVFHSTGPVVSWDGKCNGKAQPAGTYVYLIDLKSGAPVYKGTLNLIR